MAYKLVFHPCMAYLSPAGSRVRADGSLWLLGEACVRQQYFQERAPSCRCSISTPQMFSAHRYPRKSRGRSTKMPSSSGNADDSLLRLCPALEARISDLRRDNTAAAHFLNKAQVGLVSAEICPRDRTNLGSGLLWNVLNSIYLDMNVRQHRCEPRCRWHSREQVRTPPHPCATVQVSTERSNRQYGGN